jgi:hypothetical protein
MFTAFTDPEAPLASLTKPPDHSEVQMNVTEFLAAVRVPQEKIPWRELSDRVERAGKERERDFVEALFAAFEQDNTGSLTCLYYTVPEMVMDCIVRSFAPESLETVISYLIRFEALAVQISQRLNIPSDRSWKGKPLSAIRRSAAVAAQLGGAPSLASLHARHPIAIEFVACCAQEAVLRGHSFSADEQRVILALIGGHPLSRLPFERLSLESLVKLHPFLIATGSMGGTSFPVLNERAALGSSANIKKTKIEFETKLVTEAYLGAGISNARAEVVRYELEPAQEVTAELLASLPLYCTGRGEVPDEDGDMYRDDPAQPIEVFACSPEQAYQIFFSSAYSGRCYQQWSFAAWARSRAWGSLGAMCGAASDDSMSRREELIQRARFLFFTCTSSWYSQIMFDIGLLAQSEDKRTITIFAGTDCD